MTGFLVEMLIGACSLVAVGVAGLRWLRVAQREHYFPGRVTLFAWRWWLCIPGNALLLAAAMGGLVLAGLFPLAGLVTAVAVALGPLGLGIKGRSAPLRWTRRLVTLAVVSALEEVALGALAWSAGASIGLAGALAVVLVPVVVDGATALTAPLERRAGQRFVEQARAHLEKVNPVVVGVTGSYGKTTTKGYIAHLAGASLEVVASPASFNNRMGLARAVNEHLMPGTEVFVAEMGTYGPGEIAALCEWISPDIAVITAIGPVHLERFGSEEAIVQAKAEIGKKARVVVLNVDDERLRSLALRYEQEGTQVIRCGTCPGEEPTSAPTGHSSTLELLGRQVSEPAPSAPTGSESTSELMGRPGPSLVGAEGQHLDVSVWCKGTQSVVSANGQVISINEGLPGAPSNIACAVAVALELGVAPQEVAGRLASLPVAPHRLQVLTSSSGVIVLDDTYNSNPAGARAGLTQLARVAGGKKAVVTPGMVELGHRQFQENAAFARMVAQVADWLVVVGRTNRSALLSGVKGHDLPRSAEVVVLADRHEAVEWVRANLVAGDAVLYENDLPDHFP